MKTNKQIYLMMENVGRELYQTINSLDQIVITKAEFDKCFSGVEIPTILNSFPVLKKGVFIQKVDNFSDFLIFEVADIKDTGYKLWDFNYGKPFTRETQDKLLELLAPSYIEGFSLLGGEPFEPENQPVLAELLEEIRRTFPDKSIWCYSGYLFDKDMVPGGKIYTPFTDRMLSCIDVLVDGEFIQELKNLSLQFRGSSNQRILHLKDGKLIKEGL